MNTGLVVVDDTDRHRLLLETAGELAAGADAELVLLPMTTTDEVNAEREAIGQVSDAHVAAYGTDTIENRLFHNTGQLAREALESIEGEVDFTVVPKIVDANTEATAILDAAEEHVCDHIFLVGRKRSRTGKALFGSLAQTIMLTFDGQVTVELE
ncbi:universal stress protein [Natronosalvus rutilus]|uniref:Universal stress protein n=1 Tax=Natronosalvus rutilus TaxID=2953753 RepID=A0A9E7ST16_9EURY|nr:universal stress protein [Natronosalvus rutilus]UTF53199.1 universal stress protein [Natronosalvus rutilus]